jgi:hypothetical protein
LTPCFTKIWVRGRVSPGAIHSEALRASAPAAAFLPFTFLPLVKYKRV